MIKLYVPKLYILLLHTQKCTFPWQFDWSEQLWFGHTCLDQVQTIQATRGQLYRRLYWCL